MKIKLLGTLGLASLLFVSACGGGSNTNANNSNANANTNKTNTATPIPVTNEAAKTDPNLKTKIEDALKKKGVTTVTVDVTTTPATLRGTYPKGKLDEVIQAAQEANGGKPVKNEMTEAK